jgi:hypothetical protein
MTILSILEDVASSTKRSRKEKVLKDNISNDTLMWVFCAAYDPTITYWIAAHPQVDSYAGTMTLFTAIDEILANLANRKITGHAGIEFYRDILASLSADDATVLRRIIDRDLRCGVGIPTINKIWKKLIPTYDVMLACKEPKHLQFPDVVVQTKFDGARCLVTHNLDGSIEMRTRNGSLITCLEIMYDDFRKVIGLGETWDGELVCYGSDGMPLSRQISNGIVNKAIRGTIDEKEVELVRFAPWDIVDKTQTLDYDARLKAVETAIYRGHLYGVRKVIQIQTIKVETLADVERLFEEALARGEEGVIAKNLKGRWEAKRSKNQCKFKAEETADLVVVGWEPGVGKYEGQLGALVCETSDGKIRVNVGSGFSDEQRLYLSLDNTVDRIAEVKYNARITKKGGGVDSLYLARFVGFRVDKNQADSSEDIK